MDINQLLGENLFKHTLSTIFRIVNFQTKPDNNYFGHGEPEEYIFNVNRCENETSKNQCDTKTK